MRLERTPQRSRAAQASALRYPLTVALGSNAAIATLRALARHGGQMSVSALTRQTELARASVATALRQCAELGLVETAGQDRSMLYGIARRHPLATPLLDLFAAEQLRYRSTLDAVKLAAEGAAAAWVYGSVARGEDAPDSDLDVVIVCVAHDLDFEARVRDSLAAAGERLFVRPSPVFLDEQDIRQLIKDSDPWWLSLASKTLALFGDAPQTYAQKLRQGARKPRR